MRISRTALTAAFAAACLLSNAEAGQVTVSDGWFRALPAGLPAGGYFKLHNGGDRPIVLKNAQSPACGMLMLHRTMNMGGMQHMMAAENIEVAAGGTLVFAPGGYHLMCMQPTPAMKPGAIVPVTLDIAGGGAVTANFTVRGPNGN